MRSLLRKLDLPKNGAFVDLGSGKGRVLLIATQFGFTRIIGVEFSRELCEVARANVTTFARKTQVTPGIQIVESDVANYLIEPEYNVLFMYNPFDAVVMAKFLVNLRTSLTQFPRKLWLIYHYPLHQEAIIKSELFRACQEFDLGGEVFKVYNT